MDDGWTISNTINMGLFLLTAVGLLITLFQAADARKSKSEAADHEQAALQAAEKSAAAAESSADSQQRAASALGRQAEAQERALPPAWSTATATSEHSVGLTNNSSRHIVVEGVEGIPAPLVDLVQARRPLPTRVEFGDVYELLVIRTYDGSPEAVALTWRYEDETETHRTERAV